MVLNAASASSREGMPLDCCEKSWICIFKLAFPYHSARRSHASGRGNSWKSAALQAKHPGRGGLSTGTLLPGAQQRRRSPDNQRYDTERKLDHREPNKFPEARKPCQIRPRSARLRPAHDVGERRAFKTLWEAILRSNSGVLRGPISTNSSTIRQR
jgi:hypothetical protein